MELQTHFGRFNNKFEDFEKFYKVLIERYDDKEHQYPYIYVQHLGDKLKHQHTHWVIDTYKSIDDFKFLQHTSFRNSFGIKGRQQSYIKQCKDKERAIAYCYIGCVKNNLQYKTNYTLEYLDKLVEKYKNSTDTTNNFKNSDYLNVLVNDDEFIALVINSSSYTALLKEIIIKLFNYNKKYYNKYLSRKSLGDFAVNCLSTILEHQNIKKALNEDIRQEYIKKNNKVIVGSVLSYLVNMSHPDDIEYKIEKLDFKCY